ncbi:hypothetical protein CAEBREN_31036 [Caenorhabditis brenneri]|uniref:Uncharacterized protein n=1 Tax=Caenorhabditis brenneri TaxID=135651 RepID=G0PGE6_CAEBE|nr:hypothetical protein CAEBREN_31036 [Caenorhabditis brenneri]
MPSTMKQKLFNLAVSQVVSNAISVGIRLNLFKKLAEISNEKNPVLPEQLAEAAGCKERYVREWLNCMACGEIVEVNEKEQFWIKDENVKVGVFKDLRLRSLDFFQDLTTNGPESVYIASTPTQLEPLDELLKCFKKDGPYGLNYSQFSKFQDFMETLSQTLHEKHVVPDMIPAIGYGVAEKLEAGGIRVLDVGCGNGFHSTLLAERYPKTHFIGLDIGSDAIKKAKARRMKSGAPFNNLDFIECAAGKMPDFWTDSFDLVLIFDACHDQCRPDLCIREVQRVLKPKGVFAIVEINSSSNVHTDKSTMGPLAALLYGRSMMHCLPVGSNSPDALCLGSMWGRKRAVDLLNRCGFPDVRVVDTTYFPINVMYCAQKN